MLAVCACTDDDVGGRTLARALLELNPTYIYISLTHHTDTHTSHTHAHTHIHSWV